VRPRSFLAPLVRQPDRAFLLRNTRTGGAVVTSIEPAFESRVRNKGLLGLTSLAPDRAIAIAPCNAVHTFFMKFTIDVMFVDRDGTVRRVVHGLRPFRIAASPASHCVIETAAGVIAASGTLASDTLTLEETDGSATFSALS